jgi:hypothetical protein
VIRDERTPIAAERLETQPSDRDLTAQEHEAFARLDAWMASALANQQVSNAAAAAGRTLR